MNVYNCVNFPTCILQSINFAITILSVVARGAHSGGPPSLRFQESGERTRGEGETGGWQLEGITNQRCHLRRHQGIIPSSDFSTYLIRLLRTKINRKVIRDYL